MTLNDADREELIKHRLWKAYKEINHVEFLIENNMLHVAVNRIYYGIFYALSGLALKYNFATSKHGQLIGWFNKNFVKNKKVDKKVGQSIHNAFNSRSMGDYDDWIQFSQEEVCVLFREMKYCIREIEKLMAV